MRYILTDTELWFKLKDFARENRKAQTYAEGIIWRSIRNKQLGCRFRRQHAVYQFIVDFICIEKKLIIEIDGNSHDNKKEYDEAREKVLIDMGFDVIRFTNDEVIGNGNRVIDMIKAKLKEKSEETPPQPSPKGRV